MADDNKLLKINEDSQDRLLQYMKKAATMNDDGWQLRSRFEDIDRQYMLEGDWTDEQRKAKLANRGGDPTKLQNMQVPMVMESIENSVGFNTNVFLLEYPMFKFATDGSADDVALQWNTLTGEDQIHYGWAAQLNMAFRNAAKYNFGPVEVDWCEDKRYKVSNGTGTSGTKLEEVVWAGNKVESIDPYNLIYDGRVPIYKSHIEGEFGGYVKKMTRIQVKRFLATLGDKRLKNDQKAFESSPNEILYYVPKINPSVFTKNNNWDGSNFDWDAWVTDTARKHIAYKNMYTVVVLYARIMPYEFGIFAPKDQTPDIWKLISINGTMVYAEPMPNAHDYLPIIIGQTIIDNLDHQTKTQAENQMPFQSMVGALWNAKLASARRRVTDRMLYNPLLVDPDHINSPNPAAKIPIRPTAYGRKLEEAVHVFPFSDDNGQLWMQEAQGVAEWGMRANGQNRPQLGQFQKGNKLDAEWKQTMANAGNRERSQAIMLENNFIQPIKEIIKYNYQQFTPSGKRYNRATETVVTIDPVKLREDVAEFKVGDGLLPAERLVGADTLQGAFQAMQQDPSIAQSYNKGPMFSHLMKVQGVDGLEKFEKSPEQIQFEQQLQTWQSTAIELSKQIKITEMPIDQAAQAVQKIIGPMPQPPKPAGTQPGSQSEEQENASGQP